MNDDGHLRVGTAQWEHALEALRNAAADERISFEELESRVPRAVHAVNRADLVAVLDDLLPADRLADLLGAEAPAGAGPGYLWDDPLVLVAKGAELYIAGPWVVPPFLEVHGSLLGVRLDFSQAVPRAKVIDLVLQVSHGTTTIIVPEGWGVDTSETQAEVGFVDSGGVRTRAQRGLPRIIVRGRASGAIKTRVATDRDRRRAEKHLAKGRPGMPELPMA